MSTAETIASEINTASVAPKSGRKWAKILSFVVLGVSALAVAAFFIGRNERLGTKYKFSENESVYYAGDAKEADAKGLADSLKTAGYFTGSGSKDVLIRREEKKTIVSFVIQDGAWEKPEIVDAFQQIARAVAPSIGGLPITLRLVDDDIKTKKELAVE